MIYEEFIEALKLAAHKELGYEYDDMEFLPEGYTSNDPNKIIGIRDANRKYSNSESDILQMDFLMLKKADPNGSTNIHRIATQRLYEDSEEKGFEAAFDKLRELNNNVEEANVDTKRLNQRLTTDYEKIREQLILRPLNYNLHISDLKNCVYMNVGDFVLVLYQLLGDTDHSRVTSKVYMEDLKRWDKFGDIDTVMQNALENTMRLYPPSIYSQKAKDEVNFMEGEFTRADITIMNSIVLSALGATNGAVALFYPGVIEKMMKIMGGSFLAVFMNVNDIMIFGHNEAQKAELFAENAKKSGRMGEMLSGKVYQCDKKGINPVKKGTGKKKKKR